MLLGFYIQHRLKKTVAQQMQVAAANGMTGAQVARAILDANGLDAVPVEQSPRRAALRPLRPAAASRCTSREPRVRRHDAIASIAIAAHEVGHAIQHAKGYCMFKVRSAMWPAVAFASSAWLFILLIGAFMQVARGDQLALVLFAVVVLFQLVTLPVEFDASKRAMEQLADTRPRLRRARPRAPRRC